jgi:hypothetical protein
MGPNQYEERSPFAPVTETTIDKRRAGRTGAPETPVELRTGGNDVDDPLRAWIYESLGRKLGKYAEQIERCVVRFGDENGTKGGVDKTCLIQLSLSALPNVVVEERGVTEREAFDRAVACAVRAARHDIDRHGFSTKARRKHAKPSESPLPELAEPLEPSGMDGESDSELFAAVEGEPDSLIGARVGAGPQNILDAQSRPEKLRGDVPVDTSQPGVSATDRKVGYGHTAKRNTKLSTAGMTRALEDSRSDRPSRKSTRRSTNRVKADAPLTQRTKNAVHSPQTRAERRSNGT